jgi:lipoprotein-anchoring transpeptidase ErfK/SrfK
MIQATNPRPTFFLHADVPSQTMTLWLGKRILREYTISTSSRGTGTTPGSLRTPTGLFRIWQKRGHNAPAGMVFKARRPTGRIGREGDPGDLVMSRILWLDGLELHNRNTRSRYIYIHGTNHEEHLGIPASHGCIRMCNADAIELFQLAPVGTQVLITAEHGSNLR